MLLLIALGAAGYAGEIAEAEARGDSFSRRAEPTLLRAWDAWERFRDLAASAEASEEVARSWSERRALSVLLASRALLTALRAERGKGQAHEVSVEANSCYARGFSQVPPGVERADVDRLVRFLSTSERNLSRKPGVESRDLCFLLEMRARVEELRAYPDLFAAQAAYQEAMNACAGLRLGALDRVRLLRKLGRLSDAVTEADGGLMATRDDLRRRIALLEEKRMALDLQDDQAGARAVTAELLALGVKEEQVARPGGRFAGLLSLPAVDVALTADILLKILKWPGLSERTRQSVLLLLSEGLLALGDVAGAEEVLSGVVAPTSPKLGTDWLGSMVLSRLAAIRGSLGDYDGAISLLDRVQASMVDDRLKTSFGCTLRLERARCLLGLGQVSQARQEAAAAITGQGSLGSRIRARTLLGATLVAEREENPAIVSDARRAFETAQRDLLGAADDAVEPEERAELEATLAVNLGNILRLEAINSNGDQARSLRTAAIDSQNEALQKANTSGLWELAAIASSNLGELYLELGDVGTAKRFIQWALDRALERRLYETEWRCHWYLGRLNDSSGEEESADGHYAAAAQVIERYRSRILNAERKSGYLADKMMFFRDLVERDLKRGRPSAAFEGVERAKAKALLDSLGWRRVALSSAADTALYRDYVRLLSQSETARKGEASDLLGVATQRVSYDELRKRLDALRSRILNEKGRGSALGALIEGREVGLAQIQSLIPKEAVLIEYFGLQRTMCAFVVDAAAVRAVSLPIRPEDLQDMVQRFLASGAEADQLSRELYDVILGPLEAQIGNRELIIAPYGALHLLPFEVLQDRSGYCLKTKQLRYIPSAAMLQFLREGVGRSGSRDRPPELLAIVDPNTDYDGDGVPDMPPLQFAHGEVEGISGDFAKKIVLTGIQARKDYCQSVAADYDVLHYACHGEFYPARPWDSSLFLSESNPHAGDGKLRAAEIYQLDLRRSRLVTLSGCETGKGSISPGDDTVSIATAYLHAGAPSLLVSLWKVEDEATSELMRLFYKKWLREGKSKAASLREAKLELLAGRFSKPRQWGAFILVGDS